MAKLYRVSDSKLKLIKELPATLQTWSANYVASYGPQDFIQVKTGYYLSDTFGQRLFMLDDQFEVVRTAQVPYPTRLTADNKGGVYVQSLNGTIHFDDGLTQFGVETAPFEKVVSAQLEEVNALATLEAEGLTWIYLNGYLFVQRGDGTRSFYVGLSQNSRDAADFIRSGSSIYLRFDNRVLQWNTSGEFIHQIDIPRSQPDAVYTMTAKGEGTHAYVAETDTLYDVQGFRVISVNLRTGKVTDIYHQDYTNIGLMIAKQRSNRRKDKKSEVKR